MTELPDFFPDGISFGDKYHPAMTIADQETADRWLELCVQHTMRQRRCERDEALQIERSNIGYWTGYYDNETALRVQELFQCAHPIYGRVIVQ